MTIESLQIQSPKNDEEINIELSENFRSSGVKEEDDLNIRFDTMLNDDVEDISIYDTPFGSKKQYEKCYSDISPKPDFNF